MSQKLPEGMIKHYKRCKQLLCFFCLALDEAILIWDDYGREHFQQFEEES